MNEILARAARLLQNPELMKNLPNALRDPQVLARLAGLPEDKVQLLSGIGNTVSGLVKGLTSRKAAGPSRPRISQPSPIASPAVRSSGNKGTAIAGTVSLTAITGAVVAVGTVSAVALAKNRKARPS